MSVGVASTSSASPTTGDQALLALIRSSLPQVDSTSRDADAGHGSPDAVQAQYDAARDAQDALRSISLVSAGCRGLLATFARYLLAQVMQAEGFDRPSQSDLLEGVRLGAQARSQLAKQDRPCSRGRPARVTPIAPAELAQPASDEAFTGALQVPVPRGVTRGVLVVDGHAVTTVPLRAPAASIAGHVPVGRHDIEVRLYAGTRFVKHLASHDVWLLPASARRLTSPRARSRGLDANLAVLGNTFDGNAAIWVENLADGSYGAWNEDAKFPAASTVKLGVLIAALARFGPRPERSIVAYDLEQLTGWSSNLAANRMLVKLGGSEAGGAAVAQRTLAQLGATSSTYPGDYRVGTVAGARRATRGAPDPPPFVSSRVTTARDLATILRALTRAAFGAPDALRTTGLTVHEARIGLGWLLSSQPRADNLGLFRPWIGTTPMAQKNGWLNEARHTAAVVFAPSGPRLVVLLTYRSGGLTRPEAAALGRKILKVAGVVR